MVYCKTSLRNRRSCISQAVSAIGLCFYCWKKVPETRLSRKDFKVSRQLMKQVFSYASLTCVQQSVMNFGILMVQGLVNSFGTAVMAAFTAAVKIDSFACTRFRERLLYFHCTKLRSRQKCPHSERYKKCIWNNHSLLPASLTGHLPVCTTTDANLHFSRRNGNYPYRY